MYNSYRTGQIISDGFAVRYEGEVCRNLCIMSRKYIIGSCNNVLYDHGQYHTRVSKRSVQCCSLTVQLANQALMSDTSPDSRPITETHSRGRYTSAASDPISRIMNVACECEYELSAILPTC